MTIDLENALECSRWLSSMYVDVPPSYVLIRIREVALVRSGLDDASRAAIRMHQRLMLGDGNSGYRWSKEQLERATKLIARGRTTPYGEMLQKSSIDADAQLVNLINQWARPIAQ